MQLGDLGQPRIEKLVRDMLTRQRVAGSFLFEGSPGVGKEAMAIELGRLLNCERVGGCEPRGLFRSPPVAERSSQQVCPSCKRFLNLQHPDLHLVFPVPTGVWEKEPDTIRDVLQAKAEHPYHKPEFERPVGIHADVLRDVVLPAVQRKPVEARFKVVILSDADQMAFGMGNVLLKTLEEPPVDCLLVLTSAVPDRLLPTILSRCQRMRFVPLSSEWMVPRLQLLHQVKPAEARLAALLSRGSMMVASRYFNEVFSDVREMAFDVLRAAGETEIFELLEIAGQRLKDYSKDHKLALRPLYPLLLQFVELVARDALLVVEGSKLSLVNEDRSRDIQRLAKAFGSEGLRRVIRQTEEAERQIAGYVHAELTLGSLFMGMARESEKGRAMTARNA